MVRTIIGWNCSVLFVVLSASLSACGGEGGGTEMQVYRLVQAGEQPCESSDVELHFLGEEWARYKQDAGACGTVEGAVRGRFTREGNMLSLYAGEALTARGRLHSDTLWLQLEGLPGGEYIYVRQNAQP